MAFSRQSILTIILSASAVIFLIAAIVSRPPEGFPEGMEIAAWVWTSPEAFDQKSLEEMLRFARDEGVGVVYISLNGYGNALKSGEEEKKQAFTDALEGFVKTAHIYGREVEGLVGDPAWSEPANAHIPKELLQYAIDYNASHDAKLRGIQFDIEPYLQEAFHEQDRQGEVLAQYLALVSELSQTVANTAPYLELGFTLPFWFDGTASSVAPVEFGGDTKPAGFHMFDILSRVPHGYAVIMSYRDKADGENGTISNVKDEMEYIRDNDLRTKIIIAQETTQTTPTSVTFYGKRRTDLIHAIRRIYDAYKDYPSLGGFAIHDLGGLRALAE